MNGVGLAVGESVLEFNCKTDSLPSKKTAVGTGKLQEKLFQAFSKVSLGVALGQHQTVSEVGGAAWRVGVCGWARLPKGPQPPHLTRGQGSTDLMSWLRGS